MSETECKISQYYIYADDATLILDGTDISAKHSLGLLDSLAEISVQKSITKKLKHFGLVQT